MRVPIADLYDFATGSKEKFFPTDAELAEDGAIYTICYGITAGMVISLASAPTIRFGEILITQNENGITLDEVIEAGEKSLWFQGALLAALGAQALVHLATRD